MLYTVYTKISGNNNLVSHDDPNCQRPKTLSAICHFVSSKAAHMYARQQAQSAADPGDNSDSRLQLVAGLHGFKPVLFSPWGVSKSVAEAAGKHRSPSHKC
jgi:hypothetical protein